MIGELILVRHGKAEDKDAHPSDFDRKLTAKGVDEFTAFMEVLVPLLEDKEGLKVWTSPLVRAKETAAILTEAVQIAEAEEKEFLANGDTQELLQELKAEEDDFAIACVGHEPFMSLWAKELTGAHVPFPKGGVMTIVFDDKNSANGKLDWKLAPKEAKKW